MLKILQARLQQYVNCELPDVQAGFRKGRGTRDQIANIPWIMGKAREFQKNIYFCFIDYSKAFDCVDHNKLWKILKEMGIPDNLTCLLRNLHAGHEATVRGWCTGTTQRDGMGREEGGRFRMGNTCISVADSFWYMAKPIQYCKVKKKKKKNQIWKNRLAPNRKRSTSRLYIVTLLI